MNVIKPSRIRAFAQKHARAAACLAIWLKKAQAAEWDSFQEVRATFNSVDQVLVKSGKSALIFNIGGNNFRLICAVHYDRQNLYVLRFLTHTEYDRNDWKKEL